MKEIRDILQFMFCPSFVMTTPIVLQFICHDTSHKKKVDGLLCFLGTSPLMLRRVLKPGGVPQCVTQDLQQASNHNNFRFTQS